MIDAKLSFYFDLAHQKPLNCKKRNLLTNETTTSYLVNYCLISNDCPKKTTMYNTLMYISSDNE